MIQKLFCFLIFLSIHGCYVGPRVKKWSEILDLNEIRIVTINSAHTYFKDKDGVLEGFEFEMARNFANFHKLKVKFIVMDSVEEALESIQKGEADIGAAGLTITEKRKNGLAFSSPYFKSKQSIACKQKFKMSHIEDISQLKLIIPQDTSYSENLNKLKQDIPGLKWEEIDGTTSEVLLHEVWNSEDLCTIVDSHLLNLHRRYIPELNIVYNFENEDHIAWAVHKQNHVLLTKITNWFKNDEVKEKISDLKRKYFDFIEFDPYNLKTFLKRIGTRLPKYRELFIKAGKEYRLPWELLAALSYQESYWDPTSTSPTGVKGLMMLTRRTAKDMGVKNRVDPTESIFGGAKYLRIIIDRLPDYLQASDHIWFALASYNVGYYHLRDALALAIWKNENPTKWHSVQKVLPLLSNKKYYKRLPFGHARGLEPVIYVKRIKDFYDILRKREGKIAPIKVYQ